MMMMIINFHFFALLPVVVVLVFNIFTAAARTYSTAPSQYGCTTTLVASYAVIQIFRYLFLAAHQIIDLGGIPQLLSPFL